MWIEPVRDWNAVPTVCFPHTTQSVNWTCEGLKLLCRLCLFLFFQVCELNLWGIEITIPSHKIHLAFMCELNLWGIEIVMVFNLFINQSLVWIEPVRDWNECITARIWFIPLCELKLWGIETTNCVNKITFFTKCELNLWGIETYQRNGNFIRLWPCELNLWGIETISLSTRQLLFLFVWIEPVRDWNGNWWGARGKRKSSVNWTCEGLKLGTKFEE